MTLLRSILIFLVASIAAIALPHLVQPVEAWSCGGHAIIVSIAKWWLNRRAANNLKTETAFFYEDIMRNFFSGAAGRALAYDGRPFRNLPGSKRFPFVLRKSV